MHNRLNFISYSLGNENLPVSSRMERKIYLNENFALDTFSWSFTGVKIMIRSFIIDNEGYRLCYTRQSTQPFIALIILSNIYV